MLIFQHITPFQESHDEAMPWKCFLHYWPFVMGIHQWLVDSPHKGPVMQNFNDFFDISLNKLLKKQWDCCSCHDVHVMCLSWISDHYPEQDIIILLYCFSFVLAPITVYLWYCVSCTYTIQCMFSCYPWVMCWKVACGNMVCVSSPFSKLYFVRCLNFSVKPILLVFSLCFSYSYIYM